jgi:ketosteroid isomerase-like protein
LWPTQSRRRDHERSQNKQILEHIYGELANGNSRPFVEALADDVLHPDGHDQMVEDVSRGKHAVLTELLAPLRARIADQYRASAQRFIAEGDLVVAEVRGRVTIQEMTEYLDTELVTAALEAPVANELPGAC